MHCHRNPSIGCPLLNVEIASILGREAAGDFQLLRTRIETLDGPSYDFSLLNVTSLCDCLDYERSTLYFWEDGIEIRGVKHLRFKPDTCMGSHHLARLRAYRGYILVSERLYGALSKLKYWGLHFEFDRDGDNFR